MTERQTICSTCGGKIADWLMIHESDDCVESLLREREQWREIVCILQDENKRRASEIDKLKDMCDHLQIVASSQHENNLRLNYEIKQLREERDAHAQMPRTLE